METPIQSLLPQQIANHLRQVYFGKNWTASSMKDQLASVTWEQATTQLHSFRTIATLVFHVNYYVNATIKAMQGGPLNAQDEFSFDCPPIESESDWKQLLERTWDEAESLAALIEELPEHRVWENLADEKNGIYFRNLHGIIEHCHYHLGQIAMLKKMLASG